MSLYESSEWTTDSEKKLQTNTAFEEESVFGDFARLDPKFEYSIDLQQLIADSAAATGVHPDQLFPDLLGDSSSLGAFTATDDHHHGSSNVDLGDTALLTAAGVAHQLKSDPDIAQHRDYPNIAVHTPMPQVAPEVSSTVVGFTAADCPSPPEVQSADDGCDVSGSSQQVIADDVGFASLQTIDLSAAINAGTTAVELPPLVQPSASPREQVEASSTSNPSTSRGRGGRRTLKATPPSKKRYVEKDSQEYKERRERNNVAVRKSRDKAKLKQAETNSRVQILTEKNAELQRKVDLLTKELNVIRGLFINIGNSLPAELKNFFIKQEQ